MELIKINIRNPNLEIINKAAEILKGGGLLIYPTDTAYGLGGNALSEKAVRKVYNLKGRDFSKPTHVIVSDWKMIKYLSRPNKLAKTLYYKFIPGPLTLILTKKKIVPNLLTAHLPTLGVRIPNCEVTKQISAALSFPYTTPSANKSGGKAPYSIDEVKSEIDISQVDLILDAGNLPQATPSTIIDLTQKVPGILREGPIKKSQIEEALGKRVF